jgi:hypothetical protein
METIKTTMNPKTAELEAGEEPTNSEETKNPRKLNTAMISLSINRWNRTQCSSNRNQENVLPPPRSNAKQTHSPIQSFDL